LPYEVRARLRRSRPRSTLLIDGRLTGGARRAILAAKPVGCNYSVHPALTLQVRAASVVLAWLTGMPPSGRLPGLRGYFQSHP
jgi:hypothetical protein